MTADVKWMILQGVGPVQVRVLDDGSVEVHERDEAKKSTETFALTAPEAAEDLRELISSERAVELRKSFATTCTSPLLDKREPKQTSTGSRDALPGVWFAYQDGEPDDPDMRRDLDAGGSGIHPNRCIRFGLGGDGVWTAATVDRDGVLVAPIARSRDRS